MDQVKVATFIRALRNEKKLTQEELAEKFSVSRRTVSRWETGSNLPDIDILIEMSVFYDVDLREILDGERKAEKMNQEVKETAIKVAEYSNHGEGRRAKVVIAFFIIGILCLCGHVALDVAEIEESFWSGFLDGSTLGVGIGAMILGLLYVSGVLAKTMAAKRRMLGLDK